MPRESVSSPPPTPPLICIVAGPNPNFLNTQCRVQETNLGIPLQSWLINEVTLTGLDYIGCLRKALV